MTLSEEERAIFRKNLIRLDERQAANSVLGCVVNQDIYEAIDFMPDEFVDLLFIDPPYNLTKTFKSTTFKKTSIKDYLKWMDSWLSKMTRLLKPSASVYICGDWRSSSAVHELCERYFIVRNRITFEREKGRGAKSNWKNSSEDIWFCTKSNDYTFNVNDVLLKRKVIAPYRVGGAPKDWIDSAEGKHRLTHPSNIWTDITVPYWSMPENTPHPTQKPEKLLAKIILASSNLGDVVFDPFAGVGTTAVVAQKLGRQFVVVEAEEDYCLYAEKRLLNASKDKRIQGYDSGIFWERNSLKDSKRIKGKDDCAHQEPRQVVLEELNAK